MKNPENFASFEFSMKLVDVGIILDTDFLYNFNGEIMYAPLVAPSEIAIPAPRMSEVWRELPDKTQLYKIQNGAQIIFDGASIPELYKNPTDALIDLLIWVRKNFITGEKE